MMGIFGIREKSLAALLLAFMALAMLSACSSDSEEAPEETADCDNPANADEAERCLQDLDI